MRPRLALAGYVVAVVAFTLVHEPLWLGLALGIALAAAGRDRWRLLRRALWSIVAFNLAISLGYIVIAGLRGELVPGYVLLVNLRVLLLTYLTAWFVERVDLLRAVAFSRGLSFLVTLAYGQILTLRRVVEDFRLAFRSRNIVHVGLRPRYRHAAAQGLQLLDKSLHVATETTQAMRSRGFFDD
jgi:cobalt/nickel transport system permease protein